MISGLDEEYRTIIEPDLDNDMPADDVSIQRRMNELPFGDALDKGPGEHVIDTGAIVTKAEKKCHDETKLNFITHYNIKLAKGDVVWPRRNRSVRFYDI